MKRYTVKAFTIYSKWIEYNTDNKAKALRCANNVDCSRVFDNLPKNGGSPKVIFSKGTELTIGNKYLIRTFPTAERNLKLV